ncbi:putative F-box protein At3g58960 [Salvia miltiorrhiza]|uniref:putative F-box protein At3g58960 n=1 Tax=Salvia miltiorrhiza TaxID=226208 RepID=UPI0025AD942A|nr:putative F-box protein At3g58960 [Salvia miltiorrhiza]
MENPQKRIAGLGESKLPQEIIHRIQCFMSGRDAARSTLVSKSWHGAWCMRPNLCFDQSAFRDRMDKFPIFTMNSMQRYEDLNLKIKSFKLCMEVNKNSDLATELILKAIKLGAIDLTIEFPISDTGRYFVLPDEVLEPETLVRLCVQGVMIIAFEKRNKVVTSSNLKSLHLSYVSVNGDFISDLISRCPSIENLRLTKLRNSHLFNDLWPQFACLKELVIENINLGDVRICSPSLERITIHLHEFRNVMNAEFDVPNIRYFKFDGRDIPCLKFKSICSWECESDIHIHFTPYMAGASSPYMASASWFSSLNQLLKMLSPSRVSLSIFIGNMQYDGYRYVGDGSAIPVVENLTLEGSAVTRASMDSLLWSCCPKFINIQKRYAKVVDLKVFRQLKKKTLLDAGEILHFQRKY